MYFAIVSRATLKGREGASAVDDRHRLAGEAWHLNGHRGVARAVSGGDRPAVPTIRPDRESRRVVTFNLGPLLKSTTSV